MNDIIPIKLEGLNKEEILKGMGFVIDGEYALIDDEKYKISEIKALYPPKDKTHRYAVITDISDIEGD